MISRAKHSKQSNRKKKNGMITPSITQLLPMLEGIRDGFFLVDRDWTVIYLNQEAELVAQTNRINLIGKHLWTEFPHLVGTTIYKTYLEAMKTQESNRFVEYLPMARGWFETNLFPCEEGMTIYFRNITEQKEIEDRLSHYSRALENSNSDLEEFAERIAHDLKAPLASLSGLLYLLFENVDFSPRDKIASLEKKIFEVILRMRNMIDAFLDYSKVSYNELEIVEVDCNRILKDALSNLEDQIKNSNVKLYLNDLPTINTEPNLLLNLFQNIAQNAIKYKKEGPLDLLIRARPHQAGHLIFFHDNGSGIHPKDLKGLFNVMKARERNDSSLKPESTGLGLAICKKIAYRLCARISVRSVLNRGTTIAIYLPNQPLKLESPSIKKC